MPPTHIGFLEKFQIHPKPVYLNFKHHPIRSEVKWVSEKTYPIVIPILESMFSISVI